MDPVPFFLYVIVEKATPVEFYRYILRTHKGDITWASIGKYIVWE